MWKYLVNSTQAVSFVFNPGSVTADGAVVVVKRSTDPVRINNSSFSVETAGIASGTYRLVSDKTKFHLNNMTSLEASLPSGSSGNYEIYGDTPSSSMFDAELSLNTVEGTTLCTTNITVLWVDISMRCGQDDSLSEDNVPGVRTNSLRLGRQKLPGLKITSIDTNNTEASIGNVVEFKGMVHPSDFCHPVFFARDNVGEYYAATNAWGSTVYAWNTNLPRGPEPDGNDQPDSFMQDADPAPEGNIYDIDTPGEFRAKADYTPLGTVIFIRMNFKQYSFFRGRRCSDDFPWFTRTTIIRANDEFEAADFSFYDRTDVLDDNSCGPGQTGMNR